MAELHKFPAVYTPEPTRPAGGAQKGTALLLAFTIGTFDLAEFKDEIFSLGIYNPRDVCGNVWDTSRPKNGWKCTGSQHARGAAGDSGVTVVMPNGHPEGHRLAKFLVKWHAELGIQEIIFAEKRWDNQSKTWKHYSGRSTHYDHVHWAQNDAAAKGLTQAMIDAVWAAETASTPTPPEDEDMKSYIVKGDADPGSKWFLTDGINKRWLMTHYEANLAHASGQGIAASVDAKGEVTPFAWPQDAVDHIHEVTGSPE